MLFCLFYYIIFWVKGISDDREMPWTVSMDRWTFSKDFKAPPPPHVSSPFLPFHRSLPSSARFSFALSSDSKEIGERRVLSFLELNALSHAGLVCDRFSVRFSRLMLNFFAILFFLIRRCFCFCVFSNGLHLVWIIARFLLDQSSLCTDISYTATSSFEILTRNTCAKLGYASSLYSRKRN